MQKKKEKKISLNEIIESSRRHRAKIGEEEWSRLAQKAKLEAGAALEKSYLQLHAFMESPESKAREALEKGLMTLKADPEISQSATCDEILDAIIWCLRYNWGAPDAFSLLGPIGKEYRKEVASKGGKMRDTDKQAAKKEVHECWLLWQKDPGRYEGPTAFARDMREKFENLESEEVIRRWCRKWKDAT